MQKIVINKHYTWSVLPSYFIFRDGEVKTISKDFMFTDSCLYDQNITQVNKLWGFSVGLFTNPRVESFRFGWNCKNGKIQIFEYVEKDLNCPKKINLTYEERRQRLIGRVMKNSKQLYCNNGKIYESLSRAKLDCNISTSSIIKHLIGRDKTAKGYIFSYEPLDSSLIKTDQQIKKYYQETKGKGIPKSIIDNYGNIYTSIKQASLKLGMSQSSILRVLRGVQLECKGYSFKYS